ncbi:MAG TPA: alpha-amylase family glycosyl hydrolase, partial [Saprospiraceae bacterium]|nr:alpha-amylase family glycosyl hydrolase [Saprospiraceae bacterium]
TMADFDSLVARIHDLGMYVILDWVANHTAWDHPWTRQHPDWYNRDVQGNILVPADNNGNLTDWTDVADLNYNNSEMRKEMISEMLFWAKEHHVDGFRCDIAGFVPLNFWQQAKAELDKAGHFFMLAEDENPDFHTGAFHMTYAWGVHHKMVDVAKGKANAKDLAKTLSDEQVKFAKDAYRMQFIDNHDENSWQGPVSSRFGPGYKAFAVLTYIIPGMPLIYSGQESSLNKSLRFFEKDTIAFDGFYDADFYTRLNMLKHKQAALANGVFGGDFTIIPNSSPEEVLCFVRKKGNSELISLFNLSGKEAKVKYSGDGKITEGRYTEYFSGNKADIQSTGRLSLSPWEYKIYIRDL